jgi:uncharacterized protein YdeI (YjbR/CyaY-like superfamily)
MQPNPSSNPEILWDALLSRQPKRVKEIFQALTPDEQRAVLSHLQRMSTEDGWHPEQRASAQAALEAISQKFD